MQDAEWLRAAIKEKSANEIPLVAVCKQSLDRKEIEGWVAKAAEQGDGVSLYLSAGFIDNHSAAFRQQRLQQAADTGYPEAEAFLAQNAMNGLMPGLSFDNAKRLLVDAANSLPYAESILAMCEFTGCPGIEADIPAAVVHAREAAQRGNFDAISEIGPKLQASQIAPDEVQAWSLVAAMLAQQGCSSNSLTVQRMTSWMSALSPKTLSDRAKPMADDYWREYGSQMMSNIGCTS